MVRYANAADFEALRTHDRHIEASELERCIQAKRVLVLFDGDRFIGWLRFNLFWDQIPFMNMLYILEGDRGKGYGKQLLDFWEREMLQNQHKTVMTSTLSNERAQFFYRRNGYTDCGCLLLPKEPLEMILLKNLA